VHRNDRDRLDRELSEHLRVLEEDIARRDGVGRKFGDPERPLLLAVRGGSVFSMPGMLSTVLFVGINDEIAAGLARDDAWCAYDCYRRFLATYGQAVWGVDMEKYNLVEDTKKRYNVKHKYDLPWEGMKEIAEATRTILVNEGFGAELDEILRDPVKQLTTAVRAVFDSWDADAPRRYREIKHVCDSWQTAAIVQEMALGNRRNEGVAPGMDESRASLTGVIPRTVIDDLGVRKYTGDFKFSAAGDDLVGGLTKSISFRPVEELGDYLPMLSRRLRHTVAKLRRFMGTDQEIEWTVERGRLSVLQSRAAEIGRNTRVTGFEGAGQEAAHGIGIRGSGFRGVVAFDEDDLAAIQRNQLAGEADGVVVVLENPAPEQIPLILQADALLSAKGGSTSHAAIAINGIEGRDYCAVMSAAGLRVNSRKHEATIVDGDGNVLHTIHAGDIISIHGASGEVYVGARELAHV
jgi:pyruvate,orthophosphate dikinase